MGRQRLAKKLGVTPRTLGNWDKERRRPPSRHVHDHRGGLYSTLSRLSRSRT